MTNSQISTRQNDGEVLTPSTPAIARTGSTAGEIAGTPAVAISLSWDTFTAANWRTFTATNWSRFQAYATEFVAGLWIIESDIFVPGSRLGQVVIDPQTAQLQPTLSVGEVFIHTRGQIIHER